MRFLSIMHEVIVRFMLANWILTNHPHLWENTGMKTKCFLSRLESLLALHPLHVADKHTSFKCAHSTTRQLCFCEDATALTSLSVPGATTL